MRFFAKVDGSFTISGRGCVIIPAARPEEFDVHNGDLIQLRNSRRGVISTYIGSIELAKPISGAPCQLAFLLPDSISVLPETEIWVEISQQPTTND